MKKHFIKQDGQSLLEAVVGTALVTIVLTALVSALNYSLSNTQNSRTRALATKYAQEAVEWLREERDQNWFTFYSQRATDGSRTYCIQNIGTWPGSGPCGSNSYIPGTNLRREVTLDGNGTDPGQNQDRVDVTVTVYFPQGTSTADVTVYTSLSKY